MLKLIVVLAIVTFAGAIVSTSPLKRPFVGLVSMGLDSGNITSIEELYVHPNVYVGFVINAQWNEIAPTNSTYNFTMIDSMLSSLEAYNQNSNTNLTVGAKIRVHAGGVTPQWVFDEIGGPITTFDCTQNGICTYLNVSLFWTPNYQKVWRRLINALAATYDTHPLVHEVAVSSCSTTSAEPFVLGPATQKAAMNYGFNWTEYENCLIGAIDDYAAWNITPIDYTFNTLTIPPSGNVSFTISVMQQFRQRYGKSRGVIANHGLNPIAGTSNVSFTSQEFYSEFSVLGSPVEFQAMTPDGNVRGNSSSAWNETIWLGLTHYNMTEMELFVSKEGGGDGTYDYADLQYWASLFNQFYPNYAQSNKSSVMNLISNADSPLGQNPPSSPSSTSNAEISVTYFLLFILLLC